MFYLKEPRVSIEWQDGETALKSALRMEKKANTKFMTILNLALEKHDPHVSIMTKYIQVFPVKVSLHIRFKLICGGRGGGWSFQLPMQSVHIATNVVSSNLEQAEVYNIM